MICSLLFVGSYVGLQFYKGTLNIPTTSSSTVPVVNSNTNTNTNTVNNTVANTTVANTTTANTTTANTTTANTTKSQKVELIVLDNEIKTNNRDVENKGFVENSSDINNIQADKEYLEEYKNISKNYVFQTSVNTTSTETTNIYEKPCFDKAYTFLNTSFIVIGGAILFINGNFCYLKSKSIKLLLQTINIFII